MNITRRVALAGLSIPFVTPLLSVRARAAQATSLVGVIEEDPPMINPAVTSTISSYVSGSPVYSALTRMSATGQVMGDLAETWEISPDGLVYTFHLRPNIKWHDGEPFSAADVKFSLEQVNSKLHPYRGTLKTIIAFEAPDTNTFVFRLAQRNAALINTVHNYAGAILPRHLWENTEILKNPHMKQPVGTGPYKFVEYVPGDHLSYVKNENYFIKGKHAFDELTFRIMPDASARVAAFENGELDMIYQSALPATQIERLKKLPGVAMKVSRAAPGGYIGYINMRNAPYSDVRVRRALAHAIDKAFIRQTVFPGVAENMIGPLPPFSPLFNKNLKDYEYDAARANQLLDEAGFKRGAGGIRFPFRFLFASNDLPATKIGDILTQNLAAVGIQMVLTPLERGTLLQRAYIENQFDMVTGSFSLGPDPDVAIERFYNSNNILPQPLVNNSPYSNPEVDKLFDEQRAQPDLATRKAVYDKIQEIIWADIPVLPFCATTPPGAVREANALGIFDVDSTNREDFIDARPATT